MLTILLFYQMMDIKRKLYYLVNHLIQIFNSPNFLISVLLNLVNNRKDKYISLIMELNKLIFHLFRITKRLWLYFSHNCFH